MKNLLWDVTSNWDTASFEIVNQNKKSFQTAIEDHGLTDRGGRQKAV